MFGHGACYVALVRRRRSMALSILYSSGAIGGFFAVKFILPWAMIEGGSWRAGWWVIVALSAVAGVLALLFVRERPEDMGLLPDGDGGGTGNTPAKARPAFITATPWESRQVLSRPTYWLIVFSLVGGSGGYTLFLAHGIVHVQDLGHSIEVARGALATMTWTGLLAKAIIMLFGDRFDPRIPGAVFMLFWCRRGASSWMRAPAAGVRLRHLPRHRLRRRRGLPHGGARQLLRAQDLRLALRHRHRHQHHARRAGAVHRRLPVRAGYGYDGIVISSRGGASWCPGAVPDSQNPHDTCSNQTAPHETRSKKAHCSGNPAASAWRARISPDT